MMKVSNYFFYKEDTDIEVFKEKLLAFQTIVDKIKVVFYIADKENNLLIQMDKNKHITMSIQEGWEFFPEAFNIKSLYIDNEYPSDIEFMFNSGDNKLVCVSVHTKERHFLCFSNNDYIKQIQKDK